MRGKRGLVFLVLMLFVVVSVGASVNIECDDGSSLTPEDSEPDALQDCVVSVNQELNVPDGTTYYANTLTIESSVILHFFSSSPSQGYRFFGGGGGEEGSNCGTDGGNGGKGGKRYFLGYQGSGRGESGCKSIDGGFAGKIGGNIILKVASFQINGILSVAGENGKPGDNGIERSCAGDGSCGGGGGGAGGSGGIISIFANELFFHAGGKINISGGNGGKGGNGKEEDGFGGDDSGGGGGGVGGAGGELFVSANVFENEGDIIRDAGEHGLGGSRAGDGDAGQAATGELVFQENPEITIVNEICSDGNGIDEDFDNLIDMQDPDCYNEPEDGSCPSNQGPVLISEFESLLLEHASASNGSDGCCGDDDPYVLGSCELPESVSCNSNNQSECSAVEVCNWVYGGSSWSCEDICEGTIIDSCDNLGCSWTPSSMTTNDYYYVDSSNQFFCSEDFIGIDDAPDIINGVWHWWNAEEDKFRIHEIIDEKTFNIISNGESWFVCNASGLANDFGALASDNYLSNFDTLSSAFFEDGNSWCSFVPENPEEFYYASEKDDCDFDSGLPGWALGCCVSDQFNPTLVNDCNDCNDDDEGTACDDSCDVYSFFQYEDDNSDDCPVCYGADGKVFYSGQTTGNSGIGNEVYYTSKHGTDIEGYFGNPYSGCVENGGELCGQDEFCSVEYNIISSSDQNTCCYNEALQGNYPSDGVCVPIQGAEYLSCADQGGELMPNPVNSPGLYCANIIDSSDSDDTQGYVCCKTGVMYSADWVVDSPFEKFLCYQENNDSLFAECCWGDTCKNNLAEDRVDFDKYQVFTTGSALHTIISFDDQEIDDENIVEDEYKTYVRTSGSYFNIFPSRSLNWSEFDTLNFDMMYQGNGVPESFSIVNCDFDLNTSTIYDFSGLEGVGIIFSASNWYRISVDYSDCGVSDGVESLTFNYNLSDALSIFFDNFFLSSSNPNLDTRYCSAMAGKWLDGLNPSESFDNIDYSNFSSWGPYSYACDDQLSFGWTARHCCGSKTSKDNYGEYYDDINGGCFGGFPIDNEERVGDALNLPHHDFLNRLLFFDGSFLVCGPDDFFGFDSLKVSYDGIASNIDLINDSERSTLFETKGMWYCDPDGWRKLADANKMRIIAATLKEMADTDYSLHCGELDYVMNLNVSPYYEDDDYSGYVSVSDSCVLKSGSSVIIGTPISSNVIDDFLNNNLKSFHPLRDDESDYSCSEFSHPFDAHHFYQECTTGDWLNASYNEPFGILLFSLKESSSQNGFFGFFVDFWEGIVFFFTSLFDAEQSQDFISIPSTADEAEFKELYINKVGDKKIYGIREKDTIMVNYENFNSNLTFLKDLSELWFDEQEGEFSTTFNIENNNQILGINGTIVDDFNWNYLTSNLKFG